MQHCRGVKCEVLFSPGRQTLGTEGPASVLWSTAMCSAAAAALLPAFFLEPFFLLLTGALALAFFGLPIWFAAWSCQPLRCHGALPGGLLLSTRDLAWSQERCHQCAACVADA